MSADAKKVAVKPRKPWRKRLWVRISASVVVLLLVLRLFLESLLAATVNEIAEQRDLICQWDDLKISLFRGRAQLDGLEVRALEENGERSEQPLLDIEYAVVDIDVLELLAGRLSIARAEIDGMDAWWERDAEGRWNIDQHLGTAETLAVLEEAEKPAANDPQAITIAPPLAIHALRCQQTRLHFSDQHSDPPVALSLELNLGLSYLNAGERPVRFSASVLGANLVDAIHLDGDAHWDESELKLALRAQFGAVDLSAIAPYMESIGIEPQTSALEGLAIGEVEVAVVDGQSDALRIGATLHELSVEVDGAEALALDQLELQVASLSSRGMEIPSIELSGLRGHAVIDPEGAMILAGLRFAGQSWEENLLDETEPTTAPPSSGLPNWLTLLQSQQGDVFPWTVGEIHIHDGHLELLDQTVLPPATLPLIIDQILVGPIAHVRDSIQPTPIDAQLHAPHNARSISMKGTVQPFAPARSIDLEFKVDGMELVGLDPHLERAGLKPQFETADFTFTIAGSASTDANGRTEGQLEASSMLKRTGGQVFGVRKFLATGLVADPANRLLRIGDLEIGGTYVTFGRDPSKRMFGFGLLALGIRPESAVVAEPPVELVAEPTPTPSESTDGDSIAAPAPLRFELGSFRFRDNTLRYVDLAAKEDREIDFNNVGFDISGLTLGGDPSDGPHAPAHFRLHMEAPSIIRELTLSGDLRTQPGPLRVGVDLQLRAEGGHGVLLRDVLLAMGMEPHLTDASLDFDAYAELARVKDGWAADLELRDFRWREQGNVLLDFDELRVDALSILDNPVDGQSAIRVGAVVANGLRLDAERNANGTLRFAGVQTLLPDAITPQEEEVAAAEPAPEPQRFSVPGMPPIEIARIAIEEMRLGWKDSMFVPPIETALLLDIALADLSTDGQPTGLDFTAAVPGSLDRLALDGELTIGPESLRLDSTVEVSGIAAGPLEAMLPPHLLLRTEGAELKTTLLAELRAAEIAGLAGALQLGPLTWGRPDEEPWFALDGLDIGLRRFDAVEGILVVGPLTVDGVRGSMYRDANGVLQVLGLSILPPNEEIAPPPDEVPDEDPEEAATRVARFPLNELRFEDGFRIDLESLRVEAEGWTAPQDARLLLELETPFEIVGSEPSELAPMRWSLSTGLEGVIDDLTLRGDFAPFAVEPHFNFAISGSGINTQEFIARVPALDENMNGLISDGTLGGSVQGTLYVRRARPTEIGLSRPFSAELTLRDLALRDAPDGEVLLGMDLLLADVRRVDLGTGVFLIETVEIERPQAIFVREDRLARFAGVEFDLGPAPDLTVEPVLVDDETGVSDASTAGGGNVAEASLSSGSESQDPAAESPPQLGEFGIDQLIVAGADITLRRLGGTAPVDFRIDTFDAELKRFTTRAFREPRQMQYSVFLGTSSMVGDDPSFGEVSVVGRLRFFPALRGWTQLSLTGFELRAVAPLAAEQGLTISDGAVDARTRVRFHGDETARIDSNLVFTDLSLHENEGGFLESLLALPTSLDSALFLLRNSDGEHRFSLGFSIDKDGVAGGGIAKASTTAFAEVLARALAAVPFRLLGSIAPAAEPQDPVREEWTVRFPPGSTEPRDQLQNDIRKVSRKLASHKDFVLVLRHQLTQADVNRARQMANPTRATCMEVVTGLRQRKAELLHRREQLQDEVITRFTIGDDGARRTARALRGMDRELADVELGIDKMLDILRSDSPRQQDKRTRATARELAEIRLQVLRAMLERTLDEQDRVRIEVRSPRFEVIEQAGGGHILLELRER